MEFAKDSRKNFLCVKNGRLQEGNLDQPPYAHRHFCMYMHIDTCVCVCARVCCKLS